MDLGKAMIAAGIGCRKDISALQVDAAIEAAMDAVMQAGPRHAGRARRALEVIAVPAAKGGEAGVVLAAAARGVALVLIAQPALEAANARTLTRSARSMAALNVHSAAEAAALAAAGPNARLLAPRVVVGPVTCALAEGDLEA
jgi:cobalt-precorrin 5A hydrolase